MHVEAEHEMLQARFLGSSVSRPLPTEMQAANPGALDIPRLLAIETQKPSNEPFSTRGHPVHGTRLATSGGYRPAASKGNRESSILVLLSSARQHKTNSYGPS